MDLLSPAVIAYLKALHNVMHNAIQYSQENIEIIITLRDGMFKTNISDDGPRPPAEKIVSLLQDAILLDSVMTGISDLNLDKSWGIGLRFSAKNLASHGGSLSYYDEEKKNFTINLSEEVLNSNVLQLHPFTEAEINELFYYDIHNIKNDLNKLSYFLPEKHYLAKAVKEIKKILEPVVKPGSFSTNADARETIEINDNSEEMNVNELRTCLHNLNKI